MAKGRGWIQEPLQKRVRRIWRPEYGGGGICIFVRDADGTRSVHLEPVCDARAKDGGLFSRLKVKVSLRSREYDGGRTGVFTQSLFVPGPCPIVA